MNFVETKFFYKNHVLELNLKIENMSKKWPQKRKKCDFEQQHIQNELTLEKYLNNFFEKIDSKIDQNFKAFFIGKVPKNCVFNQECLENSEN